MKKVLIIGGILLFLCAAAVGAFIFFVVLAAQAPYSFTEEQMARTYLSEKKDLGNYKIIEVPGATNPTESLGVFVGLYSKDGKLSQTDVATIVIGDSSDDSSEIVKEVYNEENCPNRRTGDVSGTSFLLADCEDGQVYLYKIANGKFILFAVVGGTADDLAKMIEGYKK